MPKDKTVEVLAAIKHPYCANTACSNKLGEGSFHVVQMRELTLVLCISCSEKIQTT